MPPTAGARPGSTDIAVELLDTSYIVETPEGITLQLRLAGPVVRALAWTLDALIRYALVGAAFAALGPLGEAGFGLGLILFFLLEWFYPVLFEVYRYGATPGKQAFGLRVVRDDGVPVDFAPSLIRNLLRAADFLPLAYGAGLLSMLLNRNAKRLGDLAAGTLVIYADAPPTTATLPSHSVGAARPLRVTLSPEEQRLLLNFAERSGQLHPERLRELALLLPPLAAPESDDTPAAGRQTDPVTRLLEHARWLRGNGNQTGTTDHTPRDSADAPRPTR